MSATPRATDADRPTLLSLTRDGQTPPELLAELAGKHLDDLELCLNIAENPATKEETLVFLARNAHPAVLQTMIEETNLLERVTGIRDELAAGGEAAEDGTGADQPGGSPRQRAKSLSESVRGLTIAQKLVLAVRGSKAVRMLLIRDANEAVALETLFSPKMAETDLLAVAQMRDVSDKVLRAIADDRRYKTNRSIAWALLNNPKTPLTVSLGLGLNNLSDKELSGLGRNRNVPAALSRAARGLLDKRAEKGKAPGH
jgi:hypothetical protein